MSGPQNAATNGFALNADGSFTYQPANDYYGSDSFSYKAFDGQAYSNVVTVTLTVNFVNQAPVAPNSTLNTNKDVAASATLLANDVDTPASQLTYAVVTAPAHGTLALTTTTGQYTYTPTADYYGSDSFTWKANDGSLDSNVATVSITVAPVNHPPIANAQTLSTNENTALSLTLTGSDGDPATTRC